MTCAFISGETRARSWSANRLPSAAFHGRHDLRVGDQGRRTNLVHDLFIVASLERALAREEEAPNKRVARLATVELEVHAVAARARTPVWA